MPIISIIPSEGKVYIEGNALQVDIDLPEYIHAVQWDGSKGHVELKPDRYGNSLSNLKISDFSPFQYLVQRYMERKEHLGRLARQQEEQRKAKEAELAQAVETARNERPM